MRVRSIGNMADLPKLPVIEGSKPSQEVLIDINELVNKRNSLPAHPLKTSKKIGRGQSSLTVNDTLDVCKRSKSTIRAAVKIEKEWIWFGRPRRQLVMEKEHKKFTEHLKSVYKT